MYGGLLWGVLPGQEGISWQGHLFGAVGGVIAAWLLVDRDGERNERFRDTDWLFWAIRTANPYPGRRTDRGSGGAERPHPLIAVRAGCVVLRGISPARGVLAWG